MRHLLSLCLLVAATPAFAQNHDSELWTATSMSLGIAEGTKLSGEATARFSDDDGGLYEVEMVATLSHAITDKVEIGGGYVRTPAYRDGDVLRIEHRARQQVTVKLGKLGAGSLSARLRMEERFRVGQDDIGVRARPYLKFSLPLGEKAPSLFAAHESFVNLNDTSWGQEGGYERMRNAVGLTMPLDKRITVEAGYLNQYRFVSGGTDQMDHAGTVSLAFSL